jgi:hypothetical protein
MIFVLARGGVGQKTSWVVGLGWRKHFQQNMLKVQTLSTLSVESGWRANRGIF